MPDAPVHRLPSRAEALAREPCPRCAAPVVWGQTGQGQLVAVEPQVQTYVLVWDKGEQWPRLAQSRGYVAHQCGDQG